MFLEKLENVEKRYLELENLLGAPEIISNREQFTSYSKELSSLKELVEKFRDYKKITRDLEELEAMKKEEGMRELAEAESKEFKEKQKTLEQELEALLLPKDPFDDKNIIMEVRAGTGGEEAALFAGELLRMYLRYAERHGWKIEMLASNPTGLGGYKEASFNIIGKGAYSKLKFEGGAHRVQRVPRTESSGRIHTSAATVAVLPEADEVDVKIEDKDIRIDVYHASGAGGQNVNKVSTAIRITHFPTGIVVACQDERSQHQNREKAMKLMRSKLLQNAQEEDKQKRDLSRKIMVGTGDRSEKIRTYNFPQGRITDHRIGFTVYQLDKFLDGELDELISALSSADRAAKLAKME